MFFYGNKPNGFNDPPAERPAQVATLIGNPTCDQRKLVSIRAVKDMAGPAAPIVSDVSLGGIG